MDNIKAVIFDMDGVIVDSDDLNVSAEKAVLDRYGIVIADDEWLTFKGKTTTSIFSYIIDKYKIKNLIPEEMRNEKMLHYSRMFDEKISIFDGFFELIEYLHPKYKIALTTSSRKDIKEQIFNRFGLDRYFHAAVTGDMVTNSKPHPEPYILTLSKLSLLPHECVVIEDSDNGIISAQAAGITTIAVAHTLPKEQLNQSDYIVDNLKQIKRLL